MAARVMRIYIYECKTAARLQHLIFKNNVLCYISVPLSGEKQIYRENTE